MPRRHPTQRPLRAIIFGRAGRLGRPFARVRPPFTRVRVVGSSMVPACAPDDRLLVWCWGRWGPGDIVALVDPTCRRRLLVKRVARRWGGSVEVLGDNAAASTDSRTYGPVPVDHVIGRVVYRYAPPAAAGRITRPAPP